MPALIRQGGLLFYVDIYPLSLWRAVKIVHPLPILWHTGTILADVLPVRIASDQRELERGTGGGIEAAGSRVVTPPSIRDK